MTAVCGWSPPGLPHAQFGTIADPPSLALTGAMPEGITVTDAQTALRAAAQTWNDAKCGPAITVREPSALDSLEFGVSPVRFVDQDPCLPEGYLGFTVYSCADYPYGTILLNAKDFAWSLTPRPHDPLDSDGRLRIDLLAVLTHEIGHVLGLSHLDDPLATMAPRYIRDGGQATLAAADVLGLCAFHERERVDCETDHDCPFQDCVFDASNSVCEEERGDIGDYCGAELQICPDTCLLTSATTSSGHCTIQCGECPPEMLCRDGVCHFVPTFTRSGCATGAVALPSLPFIFVMLAIRRRRLVQSRRRCG